MREGTVHRTTRETDIKITLVLDGQGKMTGVTGLGFFDHMLELFAKHSACDLQLTAKGDIHVDAHHLVEDLGICLGQCLKNVLGEGIGINRYGYSYIPMDEALARVVVDISGRPFLKYNVQGLKEKVGNFDSELVEEFFRALVNHGRLTVHVDVLYGTNTHHMIEAVFKAFARSLKQAYTLSSGQLSVPSSKGKLD
ncbi:MAG: imidazoleglycerol-phosphate dehydratase HisB [Bacillota bacterium]